MRMKLLPYFFLHRGLLPLLVVNLAYASGHATSVYGAQGVLTTEHQKHHVIAGTAEKRSMLSISSKNMIEFTAKRTTKREKKTHKRHRGPGSSRYKVTQEEALRAVPHHVRGLVTQALVESSQAKATSAAEQINALYDKHQRALDLRDVQCRDEKAIADVKLFEQKETAEAAEQALSAAIVQKDADYQQMEDLQVALRLQGARQATREKLCTSNRGRAEAEIGVLGKDETLAAELVEKVIQKGMCEKGATTKSPELKECTLPDGTLFFTFADSALRDLVTSMSGVTEKLVSLNLLRSMYGQKSIEAGSALLQEDTYETVSAANDDKHLLLRDKHKMRLLTRNVASSLKSNRRRGSGRRRGNKHDPSRRRKKEHHVRSKLHQDFDAMAQPQRQTSFLQLLEGASNSSNATSNVTSVAKNATLSDLNAEEQCSTPKAPLSCETFVDLMGTFKHSVTDAKLELQERAAIADRECSDDRDRGTALSDQQRGVLADLQSRMTAQLEREAALRERATQERKKYAAYLADAEASRTDCTNQLELERKSMDALRSIRVTLPNVTAVPFMGDCELTDWVEGPCSVQCGATGGVQNWTREVVTIAKSRDWFASENFVGTGSAGSKASTTSSESTGSGHATSSTKTSAYSFCPPLHLQRACGRQACPKDCKMSKWTKWSDCTQQCGSGVRSRTRNVLEDAENGGRPCGAVVEEEMCNTHACDLDCQLSEWSAWSGCSKVCRGGHQSRERATVLVKEVGQGTCPKRNSAMRLESRECNTQPECVKDSPVPKCGESLDVLFLLDASGSMGAPGFADAQTFVITLTSRLKMLQEGTAGSRVGVISFGSSAKRETTSTSAMSDTSTGNAGGVFVNTVESLTSAVQAAVWQRGGTNLAEAVAFAKADLGGSDGGCSSEFCRSRRSQVLPNVVIVTDGMPESKYLLSSEIAKLQRFARISWVTIGTAVNGKIIRQKWTTFPASENYINVPDTESLKKPEIVTDVLANLCSAME
ncbi:unnamed protein product [Amoebophrya sp. A25]|nr:unnamed protein product [Amoebophrya sp. A25]|eukprot:GSA25T00000900001.1